jgi:DNA-binding MarR family transcriptional regulator
MSPVPRRSKPDVAQPAAAALLANAPLIARWTERLLAQSDPPLTVSQYLVMRAIEDGPLTASELARRTGVSGPAISQLIAALTAAGWVQRSEAVADRRRQDLALTPVGEKLLKTIDTTLVGRLAGLIADVPPPELDALARALPHVQSALAGTPPPRRPPPPRHPPPGHAPSRRPPSGPPPLGPLL